MDRADETETWTGSSSVRERKVGIETSSNNKVIILILLWFNISVYNFSVLEPLLAGY